MADVWLVTSPMMAENDRSAVPEHSELVGGLPEVMGFGRLHNLRDAMALDDAGLLGTPFYGSARTETRSLSAMVSAFKAETGSAAREELAERILHRWTGAEGATEVDYGAPDLSYTTPQRLAVVEAFRGEQLWEGRDYRRPTYSTAQKVNALYSSHHEYLLGSLMLQTHLSDLMDAAVWSGPGIPVEEDEEEEESSTDDGASGTSDGSDAAEESTTETGAETETPPPSRDDYSLNFSPVATLLGTSDAARRGKFLRSLAAVYDDGWMRDQIATLAPGWLYEYDWHASWIGRGVHASTGLLSNEHVDRDPEADGTGGTDVFRTTGGVADTLRGRGGDDEYQLMRGTGHDRIEERWRPEDAAAGRDTVRVAPGVGNDRVALSRTRDDLVVSLLDSEGNVTDSLRVVDRYVAGAGASLEAVVFGDGTEWGADEFADVSLSSGRDTFNGTLDRVDGLAQGGGGSDTYWFGTGSGDDTVDEHAYAVVGEAAVDTVRVEDGILPGSVVLRRDGLDLVLRWWTARARRRTACV